MPMELLPAMVSVCGLRKLTDNFFCYIPSRFDEGGLNRDAIRQIYERGAGLIITVDCGSVSYEEVEYAKSLGLKCNYYRSPQYR